MVYEIGKLNHETLLGPIAAAEDALARLDERVPRSEVGAGFAERADFFDSICSMWVGGELVYLEDLVLHDAQMDIARRAMSLSSRTASCGRGAGSRGTILAGRFRVRV
ncbi:Y4CF [Roseibium sp. TrichSKD4]|nr:Y4CF [Roseibium sp. TrichSKD4]